MSFRIINLGIGSEQDVVTVRQRSREVSALLGFGAQDQVRIATAVSELSRSAFAYPSGGRVEFAIDSAAEGVSLEVRIRNSDGKLQDEPGSAIAAQSRTARIDDALVSAHRLMDTCKVVDEPGRATVIILTKKIPRIAAFSAGELSAIAAQISASPVANTYTEVQLQNKELLDTLAELRTKQDDLLALTQELEDTNRGVVALYAEIEEKAEKLRQADEMKSRFLSNTSHELRTPLSSIRALSRLLLDRIDGELTEGQEKQIRFIESAASDLSELVNDLLDLAKIEAGKVEPELSAFCVNELFSTLRGMLRPLLNNPDVELIFEETPERLELYSDEGKVSQILRNFISNALKFTEKGSVKIRAQVEPGGETLRFSVSDTGIGIAPDNQQFVFEEFSQIESPLQRKSKGTGLGLPLCRKLASLLGGHIELASVPQSGSDFSLILPAARGASNVRNDNAATR